MKRAISLLVAVFALGCGSSSVELSQENFARLPREYRQEVFDAENDLVIARNREDEARDKKVATERILDELNKRWDRITKALTASGQAAKLPRARKVFDMNVAYIGAQVDVAAAAIRRAEVGTRLGRSRLDLVRQRQLARIGRATVGSVKPLEEDVASVEKRLKVATAAETELRTRLQAQLNAWKLAEDEYSTAMGDFDTGVWSE